MSTFRPVVAPGSPVADLRPPGVPRECLADLRERSRLEWWAGDGGDPVAMLEAFLTEQGAWPTVTGQTCGAAVLLSGAALSPGPGPRGPAPSVPDLCAIVYAHGGPRAPRPSDAAGPWRVGPWVASWTEAEHRAAVSAVRERIAAGDVYQVNLVGHAAAPCAGDPAAALRRVAALPGARYGGVLSGDGWAVACASPETLVEIAGRRVVTRPIKGTRPATPAGRVELLASAKERAEHVMIVDLSRNDLGRIAATGSVRVEALYDIRRWSGLWQAESTVAAELADGVGMADVLRAVFPGGSVTGAPKLAALDVIAALEPVGRGPSMGALGWVAGPRVDLGLTIRTVALAGDRVHLWAGGGITWSSDPAAEVAEARAKAIPIRAALHRSPPRA